MSTYDEICAAFRDALPRHLAFSKAIEELPDRLRTALSAEIGAPDGSVAWLTAMYQRSIPYVHVARPVEADRGLRKWEPCPYGESFSRDADGVLSFGLGIAIVLPDTAPYVVHFSISVEDVRQDAVKLVIRGAPGAIELKLDDVASYALAAKKIGDWLKTSQADPQAVVGVSATIGFGRDR